MNKINLQHMLIKICACCFAIAVFVNVSAQRDTTINIGATFEGERINQLRDADKLATWPEIIGQEVPMTSIKYTTLPTRKLPVQEPELINAAKINVDEKLQKLYRGYVKAGFGSYYTPLLDVYYTEGRSKKGTFGMHYKHLSSAGGVTPDDKDSIPDHYSDNRFEVWGKYFWNKTSLNGNLNWERNVNHWYGFDNVLFDDFPVDSMDLKQRMNTFGGNLSFMTYDRDTGDFNYQVNFGLRNSNDLHDGNETNIDFLAHGRKLVGTELFMADFGVNYNIFSYFGPDMLADGTIDPENPDFRDRTFDNAIISLVPQVQTIWNDLRVKVGVGIYLEGRGDSPGHFYPMADVAYNMADGVVVPYAGVRGGVEPTTYLGLYRENPFIQNFPDLLNRNKRLELYGGIGGAFSRSVSYNIGVNHFTYDNFAYFVNDSIFSPGNQFVVVYDDLKVLDLHGEIAVFNGDKWKVNLRGDYYNYITDTESHAWHQPPVKFTTGVQYSMRKKIIISGDVFYLGSRWAKSNSAVEGITPEPDSSYVYRMRDIVDINLKLEYRYNRRLSAWVQFHNMFAAKYQRWSGYRTQQFLGMIGASYAF